MKNSVIVPILTLSSVLLIAGCTTHTAYQVHLVDSGGQTITSLTRTGPEEQQMLRRIESFFAEDSREPESINRYLTEVKLFCAFFPDTAERNYVLHHGVVASFRGIEAPPVDRGAYTVEKQYVRHGFAQEARAYLRALGDASPEEYTHFLDAVINTLEQGIWYDDAVQDFSSAMLQSIVLAERWRRRSLFFDHDTYSPRDTALRTRYPKWYEDTGAAAVSERMRGVHP